VPYQISYIKKGDIRMSLFKFHDSNFLNKPNHPEITATIDTYNGNQFKLVGDLALPHATAVEVQAGDGYIMANIIDKPEILNTEDYKVSATEYIRAWRLKDFVGEKFDLSADLVTDAFANVAVGDTLVGRSTEDTTNTMGYKKVADVTGYEIYFVVTEKTTFGAFTIDAGGGTVAGGYVVKVVSTN
jgi:hypothetical protein